MYQQIKARLFFSKHNTNLHPLRQTTQTSLFMLHLCNLKVDRLHCNKIYILRKTSNIFLISIILVISPLINIRNKLAINSSITNPIIKMSKDQTLQAKNPFKSKRSTPHPLKIILFQIKTHSLKVVKINSCHRTPEFKIKFSLFRHLHQERFRKLVRNLSDAK